MAQPAYRAYTIAGSNLAGDGGPAVQSLIQQAEGLAVDQNGTLYIADAADHRVRAVNAAGIIRTIAGDGSAGAGGDGGPAIAARLNSPYGLALDRQGNLYIADLGNARIRRVSPDGEIRTVAGGGEIAAGDSTDGSPATSLQLKSPRNVLADANGGFYFSDFDAHRVYYVDLRGTITNFAGTGNPGYGADNISATRSALRNPAGLAMEPLGGIVIAEAGAQRLRRVARGIITAYLSDAFRNFPLYSPTGLAFDPAGNLFLADARTTGALKRTPQGEITALAVSGRAVAADPRGTSVYYAAAASVFRVDATNKVTLAAGNGAAIGELTGDGGPADSARLLAPSGLAYDRDGNLYIADERAHRIRRVSRAGQISTIAGTGRPAFSGDGGPAAKAALNTPRGLAFDANGVLYIADSGNHAVRAIAPSGAIVTVAGNGFPGTRGDGGPASAGQLNGPSGVAFDPNGDLFIADTGNHRIRRISRSGLLSTYAGSGVPGLAYDGSAAVFAQLNEPRGVAFDPAGNLYVADSANNRIRRVDATGLMTTIAEPAFLAPRGIAVSPSGTIIVADTGRHRIRQIADLNVIEIAGTGTPGFAGDGALASESQLNSPAAVAFDSLGNIAIADLENGRIRQLRPEALLVSGIAAPVRVFHAATGLEGPVAPGMLATLIGENLGPAVAESASASPWPVRLAEVQVFADGVPAPLLYVSKSQINLQIPESAEGKSAIGLEIFYRGVSRAQFPVNVAAAVPGLFAQLVMEDGSINGPNNPVSRGAIVLCYLTGAGRLLPESIQVRIGSMAAQVLWAGPAPGLPGLTQVNLRLPSGFFPPGSQPVQFRIGDFTAPGGVFLYLQ